MIRAPSSRTLRAGEGWLAPRLPPLNRVRTGRSLAVVFRLSVLDSIAVLLVSGSSCPASTVADILRSWQEKHQRGAGGDGLGRVPCTPCVKNPFTRVTSRRALRAVAPPLPGRRHEGRPHHAKGKAVFRRGNAPPQLRGDDLDIAYIERWVADLGLGELWRAVPAVLIDGERDEDSPPPLGVDYAPGYGGAQPQRVLKTAVA
jgi:hypothetical protein